MAISAATDPSDVHHRVQLRRAVIAGTVGTIIEAYDFLLYVQVAPLVLTAAELDARFPILNFPGRARSLGGRSKMINKGATP